MLTPIDSLAHLTRRHSAGAGLTESSFVGCCYDLSHFGTKRALSTAFMSAKPVDQGHGLTLDKSSFLEWFEHTRANLRLKHMRNDGISIFTSALSTFKQCVIPGLLGGGRSAGAASTR